MTFNLIQQVWNTETEVYEPVDWDALIDDILDLTSGAKSATIEDDERNAE